MTIVYFWLYRPLDSRLVPDSLWEAWPGIPRGKAKAEGSLQSHPGHQHFFPSERETHSRGSTPLRCSCIVAPLHTREAGGRQGLSIGADEKPTISIGDLNHQNRCWRGWCGQNFAMAMMTSETRAYLYMSVYHHSHLFSVSWRSSTGMSSIKKGWQVVGRKMVWTTATTSIDRNLSSYHPPNQLVAMIPATLELAKVVELLRQPSTLETWISSGYRHALFSLERCFYKKSSWAASIRSLGGGSKSFIWE